MRHPKRWVRREIRTRRPIHPGREANELEAQAWPESVRVRDCMTRGAVTIHADALVRGAVEVMRSRKIRHLPVVDREDRLVGIVTDRDVRQVIFDPAVQARLGAAADALRDLTVGDIMTRAVITVPSGAEIRHAARLMHERKIGALPVVDGERVVGILTETDVLKAFRRIIDEGVLAKPYRWALAYR